MQSVSVWESLKFFVWEWVIINLTFYKVMSKSTGMKLTLAKKKKRCLPPPHFEREENIPENEKLLILTPS